MRVQLLQILLSDGRTIKAIVPEFCKEGDDFTVTGVRAMEGYEDANIGSYKFDKRATEPQARGIHEGRKGGDAG